MPTSPHDPTTRPVEGLTRRAFNRIAATTLGAGALAAPGAAQAAPGSPKVLRYAFQIAETGFDPVQIQDLYSRIITPHIFEGLYCYDHLARPVIVKPLTAAAMPEVADDFRSWTVKVQPGIYFADDPAFSAGKPAGGTGSAARRELVAEDYVYAFKRFADPKLKSPAWTFLEAYGLLGLTELRQQAIDRKQPFDYDTPIEGLRALDRYTLRFRIKDPRPRFIYLLAGGDLFGAVAREVVEFYPDTTMAHPVGTGPFKLAEWRRASKITLVRNPHYRERFYDAQPAADDAEGQALLARFKGRRLPMIDRVEVSIIEENQPRWLSFLNGQSDVLERVPEDFINLALPNGELAPNLAKQGIRKFRVLSPDVLLTMFNLQHPVIGGYTAERVALRRAIAMGYDTGREIRLVRRGQAIVGQSIVPPHTSGYDPHFKSEMSDYDPARANALLDVYGFVDKTGDGWRDQPDGQPLVLDISTQPDQQSRQIAELWQRSMQALHVKVAFKVAKWPENLKSARAGALMQWNVGSLSSSPDGQEALERLYGPASGGSNLAYFKRPAFDAIYDRLSVLPDGPERDAQFEQAKRLAVAWMPYKVLAHRFVSDLTQPWVIGYRRPLFWTDWWQYVDVDAGAPGARG
jgi:ABC-type transport system substrate-binding protein